MAITPSNMLEPEGPITPKLFPGEQSNVLTVRLQGYIDRAALDSRVVSQPDPNKVDPMTRALALYYAFTDVYVRMNAEPMTLSVTEKGSHGYTADQIRNMKGLADRYLAEVIGFLPVATAIRTGSVAVPNKFGW